LKEINDFPPGTVVVPVDFAARYTPFYMSILRTAFPKGTHFSMGIGSEIAANKNNAVRNMVGS